MVISLNRQIADSYDENWDNQSKKGLTEKNNQQSETQKEKGLTLVMISVVLRLGHIRKPIHTRVSCDLSTVTHKRKQLYFHITNTAQLNMALCLIRVKC